MPEVISRTEPTARKQHQCDLCHGPIQPGEKYERQVCKYDNVYTWKTCRHCLADAIPELVSEWSLHEASINPETATEWAEETRRHNHDFYDQLAANRYLARSQQ